MKRILMIALMQVCTLMVWAQGINVSSFRLLENDLDANTAGTMEKDQNGEVAALIKVVSTQTGFSFDGGTLGIVKTLQKPGEIWVYVPHGMKKITISHPQLGTLRDYYLPTAILSARTYEMILVTGTIETTISQDRSSQYVVFHLTPPNAFVELDGELLQTIEGSATKLMNFGTYNYHVKAPNYLPEAGNVTVNDPTNKHIINISLKPNFTPVTLTADNGAEIWVNGERKGIGSWTGNLGAGTYELETRKPNHIPQTIIRDIVASSLPQTIHLQDPKPILGKVEIKSLPDKADIYIDGKKVGQTPLLISELLIGEHQFRLSRQGYADYSSTLTISESETTQVSATLKTAAKITISSTNPNATLYIDGIEQGTASGVKNTSIGQHQICLVADGWSEYKTTINVNESQQSFNFPMEKIVLLRRTITVGDVSFEMIRVEGGTFMIGATLEQGTGAEKNEKPSHQVTLSPYYIGETEVTQALWETVMGNNPSTFKGNNKPVEQVSWDDCQVFISKLNQRTGLSFRLPTEAEWEYAARGGNKSKGYKYSGSTNINDIAWYRENSEDTSHDVKTKLANELGLYDMTGNVDEFCQDWYEKYNGESQTNPKGPASGSYRVRRGGSWMNEDRWCRVSCRDYYASSYKDCYIGLRLAIE